MTNRPMAAAACALLVAACNTANATEPARPPDAGEVVLVLSTAPT